MTGFSIFVTWPGNPDRYLPDFIPWPSGHGINIAGFDRDEFRLGLDLAGGVSVTLEASGTAVQVRQGESLLDLSRRSDVIDTISTDIVSLNLSLIDLDRGDYDKTLRVDSLLVPTPLVDGADDELGAETTAVAIRAEESLLELVDRLDVIGLLVSLNPAIEDLSVEEYGQPLPETVDRLVVPLELSDESLTDAVEQARLIIEDRVNGFGVSEAEVTVLGDDRINAQIPGVTAEEAASLVGSTALLEFREIDPQQQGIPIPVDIVGARATVFDVFEPNLPTDDARLTTFAATDPDEDVIVVLGQRWIPAVALNQQGDAVTLTGRFLIADSIQRSLDQSGRPTLLFELNDEGAFIFERITERL
ncbi:MAG: hypothetical protein V3U83_06465, partial [Acidobacteriota bacterium]